MPKTPSNEAERVKFCPECGITIQWRATKCKSCGAGQQLSTPASRAAARAATAQAEVSTAAAKAPAWRGPVGLVAGIATAVLILSLLGGIVSYLSLYSTRAELIGGPLAEVQLLNPGALRWLAVFSALFIASSAWWVIRTAVAAGVRDARADLN